MHGEGVSVGMIAASRIAEKMGLIDGQLVQLHLDILQQYDLPVRADNINLDKFKSAMSLDKKTLSGKNQWVLLDKIGKAIVRTDVDPNIVEEVIRELIH